MNKRTDRRITKKNEYKIVQMAGKKCWHGNSLSARSLILGRRNALNKPPINKQRLVKAFVKQRVHFFTLVRGLIWFKFTLVYISFWFGVHSKLRFILDSVLILNYFGLNSFWFTVHFGLDSSNLYLLFIFPF